MRDKSYVPPRGLSLVHPLKCRYLDGLRRTTRNAWRRVRRDCYRHLTRRPVAHVWCRVRWHGTSHGGAASQLDVERDVTKLARARGDMNDARWSAGLAYALDPFARDGMAGEIVEHPGCPALSRGVFEAFEHDRKMFRRYAVQPAERRARYESASVSRSLEDLACNRAVGAAAAIALTSPMSQVTASAMSEF